MNSYFTYKTDNGKITKVPYKFPNRKEEDEYISICEEWCGGVPLDITWAKESKPYQYFKRKE